MPPWVGGRGWSSVAGGGWGCQWAAGFSEAVAGDAELVGVVDEAVEDGVGEGGVAEVVVPGVWGELAGDEGAAGVVAVVEEFEEVAAVAVSERGDAPVFEQDEVEALQAGEEGAVAAVAFGDLEVVQESGEALVEDFVGSPDA